MFTHTRQCMSSAEVTTLRTTSQATERNAPSVLTDARAKHTASSEPDARHAREGAGDGGA